MRFSLTRLAVLHGAAASRARCIAHPAHVPEHSCPASRTKAQPKGYPSLRPRPGLPRIRNGRNGASGREGTANSGCFSVPCHERPPHMIMRMREQALAKSCRRAGTGLQTGKECFPVLRLQGMRGPETHEDFKKQWIKWFLAGPIRTITGNYPAQQILLDLPTEELTRADNPPQKIFQASHAAGRRGIPRPP